MSGHLLPDKWRSVVQHRMRRYAFQLRKYMIYQTPMYEACESCPALRWENMVINGEEYIATYCTFFDKCIKQYPHKVDNKEFL